MATFKRIVAIVIIVLSIVGILISFGGILGAWVINTPVTDSLTRFLSGIENVLQVSDEALTRVNTRLGEASGRVQEIEDTVTQSGEALEEGSPLLAVIDATIGEQIYPVIESVADTASFIASTLVGINSTLEAANSIPFVTVPTLTEDLLAAQQRMEQLRDQVTVFRQQVQDMKSGVIEAVVTPITNTTSAITAAIDEVLALTTRIQTQVSQSLAQVTGVKERVAFLLDMVSLLLSLELAWLALAQAALLILAWEYRKTGILRLPWKVGPSTEPQPAA